MKTWHFINFYIAFRIKSLPIPHPYLTLAITNTYENSTIERLPGVKHDRRMLREVFDLHLNFHYVDIADCNENELKTKVIQEIKGDKYGGLLVIFSGHGHSNAEGQYIMSNDKSILLDVCIDDWAKALDTHGNGLPKVFMVDCCRKSFVERPRPKGQGDINNIVVAYGTGYDEISDCYNATGSVWIRKVYEEMKKKRTEGETLVLMLERVKADMKHMKHFVENGRLPEVDVSKYDIKKPMWI